MLKIKKRGQSTLEYAILLIIVMGAFLTIQNYVKRGIQGRWKAATDDLGEQYDPRVSNTFIQHTISAVQNTAIYTANAAGGFWTTRVDNANTVDIKGGVMTIGAY